MIILQIIRDYLSWHYTRGVVDYIHVWGNFLHFFLNFFSITLLLKTLLTPWKRMTDETKTGTTDFYEIFSKIVVNLVSRIIGFFVRTIFITMGIITTTIALILGFLGFILWFFLPIGVIILIVAGLQLLFIS